MMNHFFWLIHSKWQILLATDPPQSFSDCSLIHCWQQQKNQWSTVAKYDTVHYQRSLLHVILPSLCSRSQRYDWIIPFKMWAWWLTQLAVWLVASIGLGYIYKLCRYHDMRLDIALDLDILIYRDMVFCGFKGCITVKSCHFQNLPDCSSCSNICLYPLCSYLHIT